MLNYEDKKLKKVNMVDELQAKITENPNCVTGTEWIWAPIQENIANRGKDADENLGLYPGSFL